MKSLAARLIKIAVASALAFSLFAGSFFVGYFCGYRAGVFDDFKTNGKYGDDAPVPWIADPDKSDLEWDRQQRELGLKHFNFTP